MSFIKQMVSSRAINCLDHKPVPSQLEFSKLTSADNSFCLMLLTVILSMLNNTGRKSD